VPVHPVAREVVTASVISEAAPRAEAALPPRSPVAAITGGGQWRAEGGGQHVQPMHQQSLALDLRMPERRALLRVTVDPLLLRIYIKDR
jgi:hypothetical protein